MHKDCCLANGPHGQTSYDPCVHIFDELVRCLTDVLKSNGRMCQLFMLVLGLAL